MTTYYTEEPSGDFDALFYWRSPNKSLHSVGVASAVDLEHARKLAMKYLHETMEVFVEPVLALIQGGKKV